ncbi:hypothetical protein COV18_05100 [Candidatus Woesearchaeota archaeon CG10_big_fil_rev_8_21_14_0_10_37_12]|nr:MAG: hypothetical protein COV18_05100 [Candidatus Woesearchaeota archaeon CG10_big_fil_rev_8_21_14_0_10_37_12]
MIEELKSLGLTDGEIEVYLTLLKLGPSTNSPIAKHSGLQSSSVYYCLNTLMEKGLITYALKGNRKQFSAIDPENLPALLENKIAELQEQKEQIKQILPELKQQQKLFRDRTIMEVYEGFKGFQMIFAELLKRLKKGDTYQAFVVGQTAREPKNLRLFFIQHNKRIKERGIKLRLLAPETMKEMFHEMYGNRFNNIMLYTKEKIPVGITIYKDTVVTHISDEGRLISFKIQNKKLAEIYTNHFNDIWERAKK